MDVCQLVFCSEVDEARAIIWAALIGLAGGLLALGGAVFVGMRQVEIVARQTSLQATAIDLEVLKVNVDLFDKRFELYQAAQAYLGFILTHGAAPCFNTDLEGVTYEEQLAIDDNLVGAIERSKFLCRPNVHAALVEVWQIGVDAHRERPPIPPLLDGETDAQAFSRRVKAGSAFRNRVRETQRSLADVFGPEMNLSRQD